MEVITILAIYSMVVGEVKLKKSAYILFLLLFWPSLSFALDVPTITAT
jgi:hypothetical protein